ncbi:hypothetical protein [Ruania alba]|uniref:Uncharacterized protein n=1 Tax=Ruania alba TaxID=648782 RepID=A0A1H5N9J4_9MICO|nr:hypothetical protein [Ruania alba]SEE98223.1 hypothetical protein SAMN04488554_4095 [Ruania alba]
MATRGPRTQDCSIAEAKVRAAQSRKFLDTAELILDADDDLATPGAAAALAVLAGIAASDSLCCRNLGRRPRGQDHREATPLLEQVEPNGKDMSRSLARLLELKDGSHYGLVYLTMSRAKTAVRNAAALAEAAETALRR